MSKTISGSSQLKMTSILDLTVRLIDALPVPIGYVGTDLLVRLCGRAAADALGKSQAEIVGHHVDETFGPGSKAVDALREVIGTQTAQSLLLSQPDQGGRERHWEVSFVPDFMNGELAGIVTVGFDVTDLVETQQRVAESEHLYRSIGELLPYGTWTAAEDGSMTYVSDSFAAMAGVDRERLLGWGWLDLLPTSKERDEAVAEWHHSIGRNSTLRDTKHIVRARDGSYRHVLCRGVRLGGGPEGTTKWAGIHIDVTESERRMQFREALGVVKDMLVSSLETEAQLALVGDAVLKPTSADFAAVIAPVDDAWLVRYAAGACAKLPARTKLRKEEMPLTLVAFERGETQIVTDAMNDERMNTRKAREDGLRSIAILPIKRNGVPICLLSLAYTTSTIVADRPLMDFFNDLLGSLDLALQAATVHEHQSHIAETLQESLLAVPSHLPDVKLAHLYQASSEEARVGGDFYDAFEIRRHIAFLIGDVSGSGLEAAALTALAKNTLRAHLTDGQTPGTALTKTNAVMYKFTEAHEFATVFVGLLDPLSGRVRYSCAGHPSPMVMGPSGVRMVGTGGVLLGAFEGSRFDDHMASLYPDETMLLYTDGITEARFGSGSELYGEEGLASFLASVKDADPATLLPLVLDSARSFAGGSLEDDVAMLAITPLGMRAEDTPRE